jgi:transporter family protein
MTREIHDRTKTEWKFMPRWFFYSLVTMLLWGGWGVVSKPLSTTLSPWQVQCLSSLGLLPVLVVLAARNCRLSNFRFRVWRRGGFETRPYSGLHLRRGLCPAFAGGVISSVGNLACYQALAVGGKAAAVIPLTSLYPLVTILLARRLLHERLNPVQWGGIAASFAALCCFIKIGEGSEWVSPWLAIAMVPIALWGVSDFLQKLATGHASSELVTLAFLLGFVPAGVLLPAFQPFAWPLSGGTWLCLFLLGLFYSFGNFSLITAYGAGGRASVVTPMTSLYSLVTIPLVVLLLHERISSREGIGILLALLAVMCSQKGSVLGFQY